MKKDFCSVRVIAALFAGVLLAGCTSYNNGNNNNNRSSAESGWRDSFSVDKSHLVNTGKNSYFILQPGYCLTYSHGNSTLIITVLNETKLVDGVQTRVVEERESKNGQLTEISRNYYAIDNGTKDVYYFGEDVDNFKSGRLVNHEGAWLSGVNGARFGLMMPGNPTRGDKFYQEHAPKVAMDRSEIISLSDELTTPLGTFENVLCVRESSPLESGTEKKWYAPSVGLVKDAEFLLTEVKKP